MIDYINNNRLRVSAALVLAAFMIYINLADRPTISAPDYLRAIYWVLLCFTFALPDIPREPKIPPLVYTRFIVIAIALLLIGISFGLSY